MRWPRRQTRRPRDAAFTPVYRGMAFIEAARYREASAEATKAVERAKAGDLPPLPQRIWNRWGLTIHVTAAGLTGDAAAAQKDVEALQSAASARPDNPSLQSAVHFAQGMEAAAKKDLKAARMHFDRAPKRWVLSLAGDRRQPEGERSRRRRCVARPTDADLRARPHLSVLEIGGEQNAEEAIELEDRCSIAEMPGRRDFSPRLGVFCVGMSLTAGRPVAPFQRSTWRLAG